MSPFKDYQAQAESLLRTSARGKPIDRLAIEDAIDTLAKALEAEDQRQEDAVRALAEEWGLVWP